MEEFIIVTYNCRLNYFSNYKCNRILNYLLNITKSNYYIICLQGMNDYKSNEYIFNHLNILIIPKLNKDINLYLLTNLNIDTYKYYKFTLLPPYDYLSKGNKGFHYYTLSLFDYKINIYNTELYENINLINNDLLNEIVTFIISNNYLNNLHLIIGSLYCHKIKLKRLLDLNKKLTNIDTNEIDDNILFYISSKINNEYLTNFLKNDFNLKINEIIIRNEMNFSQNLPIEIRLIIEK